MRKSTERIKRVLALFLVVLMSINTFAAVVSDNDGAAFITKAEFDSLKNDFQSQINRYNESIDNKIDGAIAAYLEGVSLQKQEIRTILFPNACDAGVTSIGGPNKPAFKFGYPRMSGVTMRSDFQEKTDRQSIWAMTMDLPEKSDDYKIGKTVITNLDTNKKIAEWKGYYNDCYDNLTVYSVYNNYKWNILANWEQDWAFVLQSVEYYEDQPFLDKPITCYLDCWNDWNNVSSPGWQTNPFSLRGIEQEWGGKTMEYVSVLEPWNYDMFSNYDRNYNWCYKGTYQTKFDGIENNVSISNYYSKSTKNLGWVSKCATNITFVLDYSDGNRNNTRITDTNTVVRNDWPWRGAANTVMFLSPMIGFETKYLKNWNQLYLANTSAIAANESTKGLTTENSILTGSDEKKYLSLTAGFPLIEMKKGDSLKYDITFEDKTKDYVIWASYKPFKNTGFPDDDANCVKLFDRNGIELNKPTNCQRGYLVTNGEETIYTPEIDEDGYLYIKFGIYDSEKANIGGGVFKPVETGVITKA